MNVLTKWSSAALLCLILVGSTAAAQVPPLIPIQGHLEDADGAPVDGEVELTLRLYDLDVGGALLYEETQTVAVAGGWLTVYLGDVSTLDLGMFTDNDLVFLGVAVDGAAEMAPRLQLATVAYTARAASCDSAVTLGGMDASDFAVAGHRHAWGDLTGVPASFAPSAHTHGWGELTGVPAGFADGVDNDSGGDITGVTAGAGLSGGGATGEVTLQIATGGVTGAMIANGTITNADISATAAIAPEKIAGTAWTSTNDGVGSGLDADLVDGRHSWQLAQLGGNIILNSATEWIGSSNPYPFDLRANGLRALRLEHATDGPNVIGGHWNNTVTVGVQGATVFGGGIAPQSVTDDYGTVAGGYGNRAGNAAGSTYDAMYATVGGGRVNHATALGATVPGGDDNTASGRFSFAAGRRAKATREGCFVWGDATAADVGCPFDNSYVVRASGGVYVYTNSARSTGAYIPAGSGSWTSLSDRDAKRDLERVDPARVLAKVAALPISEWSYLGEGEVRHVGPMAQDFHAAFGLGPSERHIATVDADGIALAAIQGLHREVTALQHDLIALRDERDQLRERLDAVDTRLARLEADRPAKGGLAPRHLVLGVAFLLGGTFLGRRRHRG